MPPEWEDSFVRELKAIVALHPRYVWGGAGDPSKGLDCSGFPYVAARRAAIPGVNRTTSARMAKGLDGWDSIELPRDRSTSPDLVFWTFKPERPDGHVGVLMVPGVAHAGSNGVENRDLTGKLNTNVSRIRRLTIGDGR